MVDRGRIGRSCGVWLFSGGCVYVGVLGKGFTGRLNAISRFARFVQ